jgi:hypothetical protein
MDARRDAASPPTGGRILALTDRCTICSTRVRAVVGVLADERFVAVAEAAELLLAADRRALAARGIGGLRRIEGMPDSYVASTCPNCGAVVGRLRAERLLNRHLAEGGSYAQLDVGVGLAAPTRRERLRRRRRTA